MVLNETIWLKWTFKTYLNILACHHINFEWELKKETLNKEIQYKQAKMDLLIHKVCTHIYFTLDIWYKIKDLPKLILES